MPTAALVALLLNINSSQSSRVVIGNLREYKNLDANVCELKFTFGSGLYFSE